MGELFGLVFTLAVLGVGVWFVARTSIAVYRFSTGTSIVDLWNHEPGFKFVATVLAGAATVCLIWFTGFNQPAPAAPKTHEQCMNEHMKRLEGIYAFSSGDSTERMKAESVKTMQDCSEQALQNAIRNK